MNIIGVIFCAAGIFCFAVLLLMYFRLRAELAWLRSQLEEIGRGSQIELVLNSRQRPLVNLCLTLNEVLASKDRDYSRYDRQEKLLKQNITGLAHDIRTPLTGAFGFVQFAMECLDADKRAHYLHAAEKRLSELEDMLEEMFLYTKLTGEDFALTIKKISVYPLLIDCLLGFYTRLEEMGCEPQVMFESEAFQVRADEDALRRVFQNLIQNALVHGEGGLSIIQKENALIFENLLAPDSRPEPARIFDRFYKRDPARRKGSSGLGLFIVKDLMERMGGSAAAQVEDQTLRIILQFQPKPAPDAVLKE